MTNGASQQRTFIPGIVGVAMVVVLDKLGALLCVIGVTIDGS